MSYPSPIEVIAYDIDGEVYHAFSHYDTTKEAFADMVEQWAFKSSWDRLTEHAPTVETICELRLVKDGETRKIIPVNFKS